MKSIMAWLISFSFITSGLAQPDVSLHETAKAFMRSSDYANATLVLNHALQENPKDFAIRKDLSLCYFFQHENILALETIKPLLDGPGADDQSYQIAGQIYQALGQPKELEKLYRKGIKKFPESGALYAELGSFYWGRKQDEAITYWEKGIRLDPTYGKNYYLAAKYYYQKNDIVWTLLYAELFVNIEPNSHFNPEMKDMLLDSYKKYFTQLPSQPAAKEKNLFVTQYQLNLNNQRSLVKEGIYMESLTMIRTRFILDWNREAALQWPFKLFEYHTQLLREGLFEAYQQWLFGASENLMHFQQWTKNHPETYQQFVLFQKNRLFKIPKGQYYR